MANSVSKINVQVGANVSQLQSGMNQAAGIVGSGMNRMQSVAQQATFAVDDFFAAFSTGGVAGGVRGAANNLTAIASQLGGIKVQLLAIGALAVAGLIAKQWEKTGDAISKADGALADFQNRLQRGSAVAAQRTSQNQKLRDIFGERSLGAAFRRRDEGRTALADLQAEERAVEKRLSDLRQLKASVVTDEATKAIEEEIAARQKASIELSREIREQKELNRAMQDSINILQRRRAEAFKVSAGGGLGGMLAPRVSAAEEIRAIDDELARLRSSRGASLSMQDVFRMLPGANSFGSSGAVGAINASMIGPANARDAGPALQRETNNILKRIEELEKKKKGLVEVVGL